MNDGPALVFPITAMAALAGAGWSGYEVYDGLATKEYVAEHIAQSTGGLAKDLDRIVAGQIALQLNEIYRAKCEGYSNRDADILIMDLEAEHIQRSGRPYRAPSCELLTRGRT